jgi:ribonuclease PH
MRVDGRRDDELRQVKITGGYARYAEGSALVEVGNTRVICTATLEDRVPLFLKDKGKGWVTAEYSMLPRSTPTRSARDSVAGRISGRSHEIQRLIGRSLRSVVDLGALGERTIWLDCDVIQADGGTRTASITGAFISLAHAVKYAMDRGMLTRPPIRDFLAAISVGVVDGAPVLDLCYEEDVAAEVDMNVVMTGGGEFVELQGTAERKPFGRETMGRLLDLAASGIKELVGLQRAEIWKGVIQ